MQALVSTFLTNGQQRALGCETGKCDVAASNLWSAVRGPCELPSTSPAATNMLHLKHGCNKQPTCMVQRVQQAEASTVHLATYQCDGIHSEDVHQVEEGSKVAWVRSDGACRASAMQAVSRNRHSSLTVLHVNVACSWGFFIKAHHTRAKTTLNF